MKQINNRIFYVLHSNLILSLNDSINNRLKLEINFNQDSLDMLLFHKEINFIRI